jgi:hypothetical protein
MDHKHKNPEETLRDWWERDDVLTGLLSGDKHNSQILFNIDRANKAIGRMMDDLKAVTQNDELKLLHREMVPRNLRLSGDDDIYKFRAGKNAGLNLVTILRKVKKLVK